jgi:hypothetical protein
MHPEIAKTLVEQRRSELAWQTADSRRDRGVSAGPSWLSRHMPHWHVSWTRTVLSPAAETSGGGSDHQGRSGKRGSSLVIIISAYH